LKSICTERKGAKPLKTEKVTLIFSAVAIAAILLGELLVYGPADPYTYGSGASFTGDGASYTIQCSGSSTYEIIALDNGRFEAASEIYILDDSSYAMTGTSLTVPRGTTAQDYCAEQLQLRLKAFGTDDAEKIKAHDLALMMEKDLESGMKITKGLAVVTGALPDTIYSGHPNDLIIRWIEAGGRLYWCSGQLGRFVATTDGLREAVGWQSLFLGGDKLCEHDHLAEKAVGTQYEKALSLCSISLLYAADATMIPDSLPLGWTDGRYSSIVLSGYGNGMICIVSGVYGDDQAADLAHVIASGVSHLSNVLGTAAGTVSGSVNGRLAFSSADPTVYICLGGQFPVYGRAYRG
jgi:hypothetical protein